MTQVKKLRVLATGLAEQKGAEGKLRSRSLTPSAEKIRVTALTLYSARTAAAAAADDKRIGGPDTQNSSAKDDDNGRRGVDQVPLAKNSEIYRNTRLYSINQITRFTDKSSK